VDFWPAIALAVVAGAAVRFLPIVPERWRVQASLAVFLLVVCWMPFTVGTFKTSQMTTVATWAIVAIGLNLLTGYNGQISLGHGAFVTIGAYTVAILTDSKEHLGFIDSSPWPFWVALAASGVVAAAFGFAVGVPALRLSGPYLAVASLGLVIALPPVLAKYDGLTGGRLGIRQPQPPPPPFLDDLLNRDQWFFFMALITLVLMALLAWLIVRSRWGRAFVAVRDSEVAAMAAGIPVAQYKVMAFTVSAFYGGIAGGVFMSTIGLITPESIGIVLSINYFTAIVIGGLGSIMGAIIGGFVLVFLPDLSTQIATNVFGDRQGKQLWPTVYGAVLIGVIILMPHGIAGTLNRLSRLRPAQVAEAAEKLPGRLRRTVEQNSWAWDIRPRKRRREHQQDGGGDAERH
jgi:branched-chain amino acid transport system permease protein